jgi:hypothetical protein
MLVKVACFEIGSPAAYFTGDSHGQTKEACCGAQESLETRESKRQACAQEGNKARDAKKEAAEDRGKKGTKESAKTSRASHRRHNHRRDR